MTQWSYIDLPYSANTKTEGRNTKGSVPGLSNKLFKKHVSTSIAAEKIHELSTRFTRETLRPWKAARITTYSRYLW